MGGAPVWLVSCQKKVCQFMKLELDVASRPSQSSSLSLSSSNGTFLVNEGSRPCDQLDCDTADVQLLMAESWRDREGHRVMTDHGGDDDDDDDNDNDDDDCDSRVRLRVATVSMFSGPMMSALF
jgi:hypothetical protein